MCCTVSPTASIVQGSVIGPFAYVINASDLRALYALDKLNKYADDSYLIVPSINSQLVREELDHISTWASNNNLKLNVDKSKEMIIKRPRTRSAAPPPLLGIERVESMNILGVIFQCNLSFTMQVDRLVVRGAQTMYALGTLKHHGLSGPPLWEVTRATFIARLTYASQAWWGLLDAQGRARLEKVLNKAVREGFLPKRHPSFAQICDSADEQMFGDILKNPKHVLHHLLPPVSEAKSRLRTRAHDREMPAANQNTFTRKTFINRMLMLNSYWIRSLFLFSFFVCVRIIYFVFCTSCAVVTWKNKALLTYLLTCNSHRVLGSDLSILKLGSDFTILKFEVPSTPGTT